MTVLCLSLRSLHLTLLSWCMNPRLHAFDLLCEGEMYLKLFSVIAIFAVEYNSQQIHGDWFWDGDTTDGALFAWIVKPIDCKLRDVAAHCCHLRKLAYKANTEEYRAQREVRNRFMLTSWAWPGQYFPFMQANK